MEAILDGARPAIEEALAAMGLTGKDVAAQSGRHPSWVSRQLTGSVPAHIDFIQQILDLTGAAESNIFIEFAADHLQTERPRRLPWAKYRPLRRFVKSVEFVMSRKPERSVRSIVKLLDPPYGSPTHRVIAVKLLGDKFSFAGNPRFAIPLWRAALGNGLLPDKMATEAALSLGKELIDIDEPEVGEEVLREALYRDDLNSYQRAYGSYHFSNSRLLRQVGVDLKPGQLTEILDHATEAERLYLEQWPNSAQASMATGLVACCEVIQAALRRKDMEIAHEKVATIDRELKKARSQSGQSWRWAEGMLAAYRAIVNKFLYPKSDTDAELDDLEEVGRNAKIPRFLRIARRLRSTLHKFRSVVLSTLLFVGFNWTVFLASVFVFMVVLTALAGATMPCQEPNIASSQ